MKTCPACGGLGWITYKAYDNLKPEPCLDVECITGAGQVPEDYTPEQPTRIPVVRNLPAGMR